jgi:hypothetical protein
MMGRFGPPERPGIWHKDVLQPDIVAASTAQAADVPGVVNDRRGGRHHDDALLWQAVLVKTRLLVIQEDAGREADPVSVVAAAAIRPPPRHAKAAVDHPGVAVGRGQGAGHDRIRVAPVHFPADFG